MSSDETTPNLQVNDDAIETIELESVEIKEKRKSIMDIIREKQNDQDFKQKMNVASTLVLEIYRVLMGAFLVVFADTVGRTLFAPIVIPVGIMLSIIGGPFFMYLLLQNRGHAH